MDGKLQYYHLNNTRLRIIQSNAVGSLQSASTAMLRDMYTMTQATIDSQRRIIDSLQRIAASTTRIDTMSVTVAPELKIIYPQISDIAIAHTTRANTLTGQNDTLNVALISYNTAISPAQQEQLTRYLRTRLGLPHLKLITLKE